MTSVLLLSLFGTMMTRPAFAKDIHYTQVAHPRVTLTVHDDGTATIARQRPQGPDVLIEGKLSFRGRASVLAREEYDVCPGVRIKWSRDGRSALVADSAEAGSAIHGCAGLQYLPGKYLINEPVR